MATQSYATHRRWLPIWHFFALPVTALNVVAQVYRAYTIRSSGHLWDVLQAIALVLAVYASRTMALSLQNRLIRHEMRHRLEALLSGPAREGIMQLNTSQLIGLRFASDAELPELVARCLSGQLTDAEAVKREIVTWIPDEERV